MNSPLAATPTAPTAPTAIPPTGNEVLRELRRNKVQVVVTVPDWVQMPLHRALQGESEGGIRTLNCCTEHEAFMIAGGLYIGGMRSAVVIQQQGLYAGLNALRGIGLDAGIPIVMLMGQFGREVGNFDKSTRASKRRIVHMLEPLLDTLEIAYVKVERADEIGRISDAYAAAERTRSPVAVIFDRNLSWE